ncbi:protein-tyrosine phosphatase [Streptacidiphilus sp. MAP12-20]
MGAEVRDLDWEGCWNARDLGGLELADGRRIRRGAVVRSDAPDRLTDRGWAALRAHGVRTVVDLRDPGEGEPVAAAQGLEVVRVPLDRLAGPVWWERWGELDGTPLTFRPALEHTSEGVTRVLRAVIAAPPGGVLVHCAAGRDRTGLFAFALLASLGVAAEDIAADYTRSGERLDPLLRARGREREVVAIDRLLADHGTTATSCVMQTVAWFRAESRQLLDAEELKALHERVTEPAGS